MTNAINAGTHAPLDVRQANRAVGSVDMYGIEDARHEGYLTHKYAKKAWNKAVRRAVKSQLRQENS